MSQKFVVYEDGDGDWRWRLWSGDTIIADSGEGYHSKRDAMAAIGRVQREASEADVLEFGTQHFEIYKDIADEWRWRMVAANGRIVSDSGEGYESKRDVYVAIDQLQDGAHDADIEEE